MTDPLSLSKEFSIDAGIFTAAKVTVGSSADANAIQAVLLNSRFPDGDIKVGNFSVKANTGEVSLQPSALPAGTSVSFDFSASAQSGMGVYDRFADALSALNLTNQPSLKIADVTGRRYLLLSCGYSGLFSGSASHPVGMLGSVSFGVDAKGDSTYALLHRFDAGQGASDVIQDSSTSWRLPRHVAFDGTDLNIKPETWLLVEVDGSLALNLAATLGWNINYARDLELLGITHNLSAKIEAGLSATFGFDVSGKYILVVGREGTANSVRLCLSRQQSKGLNFGFNLNVGVQGADPQLPANFDDFIKSTFGVHGIQVLTDLRQWTDPSTDLGQKIAGLADQTALDLLKSTTGIDPAVEFDKAKQIVADALNQWSALPAKLSSMLWTFLGKQASPGTVDEFKSVLADLADPAKGASAFAAALQKATFGDSPAGQFLASIADQGILALANDLTPVTLAANQVINILDGGVIAKLQSFIGQKLDLDQIRNAASDADFAKIDKWLQDRLANFLDKKLGLDDLKDIQKAIRSLDTKVAGYYKTAVQAMIKKYNFEFAATYQRTATDTALIDVVFDLSVRDAASLFQSAVAQSNLDSLLSRDTAGVSLKVAALSHDIGRKSTVDLHMPVFDFTGESVTDAMVSLTAEEQGGRILLYQIHANNSVTVKNRTASQLAILANLKVAPDQAPQLEADGSISYEMRQVKASIRPIDLKARTETFLRQYLAGQFGVGDASLPTFYVDLNNALAASTHNEGNILGDVVLSMQLSLQSAVLSGWFRPRDPSQLTADQMTLSHTLQAAWKSTLPALYFQSVDQYQSNEAIAAMLVWSAMPVSTTIDASGETLRFNTSKGDVYWDFADIDLRRRVARDSHTVAALAQQFASIHAQLIEAGSSNAAFFDPSGVGKFIDLALNTTGDNLLRGLLFTEAQLVQGAADALKRLALALATMAARPAQAMRLLADFAAQLTDTFNENVSSTYTGISDRIIGPMLLVQASAALGSDGILPSAMFILYALNPTRTFDLSTFITGSNPAKADVALMQSLVSLT
ncbi:MAG TPA: hypothetical protein VGL22_20610 [Terracidiphilus sp.]